MRRTVWPSFFFCKDVNTLYMWKNGMPTKYLDEEGLSHVVDLAKKKFADKKELWNWQKTEKAGAVAFEPVPDSVLEPIVEFKFKETLPAEGEKGPDNPSSIQGVQEITVRHYNKNLLGAYQHAREGNTFTVNNVDFTYNQDGSILINGKASALTQRFLIHSSVPNSVLYLRSGNTYTLSAFSSSESDWPRIFFKCNNDTYYYVSGQHQTTTVSITQDGVPNIWIEIPEGMSIDNLLIQPQLEIGSSATPFEASLMDVYSINLGDTYYGGSIDLNSGLMTVTWYANTFNGTELWYLSSEDGVNQFLLGSEEPSLRGMSSIINNNTRICSHFSTLNGSVVADTWWTWANLRRVSFDKSSTEMPDLESWKSWVASEYEAGHPLTIAYQLYEPFTVQLTPQQIFSLSQSDKYKPRTNTVYTDVASVQVGYQRFADEATIVYQDQRIPDEEIDEAFAE